MPIVVQNSNVFYKPNPWMEKWKPVEKRKGSPIEFEDVTILQKKLKSEKKGEGCRFSCNKSESTKFHKNESNMKILKKKGNHKYQKTKPTSSVCREMKSSSKFHGSLTVTPKNLRFLTSLGHKIVPDKTNSRE